MDLWDVLMALCIGLLVLAIWAALQDRSPASKHPVMAYPDDDEEAESFTDHMKRDPVGFVRQYGTPEDAQRFKDQGIDLEGLGYQPPSDR